MKNKVYNRNETRMIHEPYVNDYCEKCIHSDGDTDNLCCRKIRYVNCGAVVDCAMYKEVKEND